MPEIRETHEVIVFLALSLLTGKISRVSGLVCSDCIFFLFSYLVLCLLTPLYNSSLLSFFEIHLLPPVIIFSYSCHLSVFTSCTPQRYM